MSGKVIISCAITGAVHTPTMSAHLPFTPEQIADQAVGAAEAGAAILHLHARDPGDGRPTADPAVFQQFLPRIKERTRAIVNITSGGSTRMSVDDRLAAPLAASPEMASLNMGSMNFSLHPMAEKISNWRFDWERSYVEGMADVIFRNTFKDIEKILQKLGEENGTRFEFECYDIGHLYNLAYFVDKGLVKPPFLVQTIFGILGGIGAHTDHVVAMRQAADRLFGKDYVWSLFGVGRHQMTYATYGAIMGANVRVGLEDGLYLEKGRLAQSSAEQVTKIRRILKELSIDIASPDEARQILHLKGPENVKF